jgi:SAM-dependent methyltransferase
MQEFEGYLRNFQAGTKETPRFWARFPELPDLHDRDVIDFGSGNGHLSLNLAQAGARSVIGVEVDPGMVNFSACNLREHYPSFVGTIEYRLSDLTEFQENSIDFIFSKDVLEHVINLDQAFENLYRILKPGGKFYAGFGPLYYSPFGFHRRLQGFFKFQKIDPPWLHVILPEPLILGWWNKTKRQNVHSIFDLGLNKVKFAGYLYAIKKAGFKITWMQINGGNRAGKLLFALFRRIPRLIDYFIYNVYIILGK